MPESISREDLDPVLITGVATYYRREGEAGRFPAGEEQADALDRVGEKLMQLHELCAERGLPYSAAALARHERGNGMAIVSFRLASALWALDQIYEGKRHATGDTQEYAGSMATRIRERMDEAEGGPAIADYLRARFITRDECRACDGTGSIPGNNMGDPSTPCHVCGRGKSLAAILRELEADNG